MLQRMVQILFHMLPVGAVAWDGRIGIILASALLVCMPYIKTRKLMSQLTDCEQSPLSPRSEELRKLIKRWQYLTLLR